MHDNHPIIIIDDDEDDRLLVLEGFKKAGCKKEVIQFENGLVFMQFLHGIPRNEFPSLVLLDLNMPLMDGKEVLRQMKSNDRFRQIPVIIYTTSSIYLDREFAITEGANCFITKPDSFDNVVEVLRSVAMLWCL